MAKLILEKDEFTVTELVDHMKKEFINKTNGSEFTVSDIHDWVNKGRIPKNYGGQSVSSAKIGPLKIVKLSQDVPQIIIQTKK